MARGLLWGLAVLLHSAHGFIDDILNQAFGGGGGFHMQMGGMPRMQKPKWPRGVTDECHVRMKWLKGTTWMWNDWREVQFEKDGTFKAPTQECQHGLCKWTASEKRVYVWWGSAGLHTMKTASNEAAEGTHMVGKRAADGDRISAEFVRQHDEEALDLERDLYAEMDLPLDADEGTIKKKYRRLSIEYHPDKCSDDACRQKFHTIRSANEILSDPEKKILYDTGGMQAVKDAEKGQVEKGDDVSVDLPVTLADLYKGDTIQTSLQRRVVCIACNHATYASTPRCRKCNRCPNEVKTVMQQMGAGMYIQQQQEIPSKHKCMTENTSIEATVEKGMDNGSKIRFPRMSEQRPGIIPGDVVFSLKTKKHDMFDRKGKNLWMTLTITLQEALLGFKKSITHLDGHEVVIKRKGVTKPEMVMKIDEEGMPVHNVPTEIGALFVKFKITYPDSLSGKQQQLVEQLFETRDEL